MKILTAPDSTIVTDINYTFPLGYSAKCFKGAHRHDELAPIIREKNLATYMVIVVSERLAASHWDNPQYLHYTNSLGCCVLEEEARRELTNRYFNQEELDAIIKSHSMPTWRYNYKDPEGERKFKFELEDALFQYQIKREMLKFLPRHLEDANFKFDEEGWLLEDDDGEYVPEVDPEAVKTRKDKILEDILIPRVFTETERVYNMPQPLHHWDARSRWHQFFFVDIPEEELTVYGRGHCGGSGSRHDNGKWAHTFAELAETYGVETPTYILRYDKDNILHVKEFHSTFRVLDTDLSGNYASDPQTTHRLFDSRTLCAMDYVYNLD